MRLEYQGDKDAVTTYYGECPVCSSIYSTLDRKKTVGKCTVCGEGVVYFYSEHSTAGGDVLSLLKARMGTAE